MVKMQTLFFIMSFLITPHSFAQTMGITSSISMQTGGKSSSPIMMSMNMKLFNSKIRAGRTYIDQGNYEEALAFLKLAEKQKKTAKLYEYFGDAYSADRNYPKAISSYRKSFKLYLKQKNIKKAKFVFITLRHYETDKTKSLNDKLEKELNSL